jgi:hypothetical protein
MTNEQLFRILIEEGFSKGNVSVFDQYTSPDFIEHQYGMAPQNIEGVKKCCPIFTQSIYKFHFNNRRYSYF